MAPTNMRIVLYYKALVCSGGAERLFAKEYEYLSSLGYDVIVVANRLERSALFGVHVADSSLVVVGKTGLRSIFRLSRIIKSLGSPPVLCSSGHLDVYLASLIGGFQYALHIHHPCFMSYNDYDKYSIFTRHHFESYTRSNFGASQFFEIRRSLSFWQWIHINIKAALSIASKRRARCSFVLSRYAKREKRDLYGIETEVLCGALDDNFQFVCHGRRDSGRFALLTVARLDINKRIDKLIQAVALLVYRGYNVSLRIVGIGPEKQAFEELVDKLDLRDRVEFKGFVSDEELVSIYADSDLFVSIDWADYKITLFESLAKGIPAIVSDETECDDRLIKLGYVKLVPPTAEAVSEAIASMVKNPISIKAGLVQPILNDYTWGRYFHQIASSLAKAGLLSPPRRHFTSPSTDEGVSA